MTTAETTAGLRGNWTADIQAFDEVHKQAMDIADALSQGIMMQFPDRFVEGRTQ